MTELQIKNYLKDKHEEFIDSLYGGETKLLIRNKTYFAGGCIRDLNNSRIPKDYDLFFYDKESMSQFIELSRYEFSLKRTRAGNFNCKKGTSVQVITVLAGEPDELVKTFDFTINNGFYCTRDCELFLPREKVNLILNPEVYSPFNALLRVSKFVEMGYKISDKTLFKLGLMMVKFEEASDAIESLVGVSTSYLKKDDQFMITAEDFSEPCFTSTDDIPF